MNTTIRVLGFGMLLTLAGSAVAALPSHIGDKPVTSLAPLVEATSPAVVNITRVGATLGSTSPRTVSNGSSVTAVRRPTPMASNPARSH